MSALSRTQLTRGAGLLYLILIISGVLSILVIPSQLILGKNAAQTIANIQEHKFLYQTGIVLGIVLYLSYLFLVLFLFQLLKTVDLLAASLMMILVLVSIPIALMGVKAKLDVLSYLKDAPHLALMSEAYIQAQVMQSLLSFNNALIVAQVFWGLWLFPLGWLVFHSRFLPKFLGIMLMIGCFYYMMDTVARIALPWYIDGIVDNILSICALIGEFGLCFWMLILGDRPYLFRKKTIANA
ncbi:MAG: DUF4386 domain-containing protein [Bacteroidota bacterium]